MNKYEVFLAGIKKDMKEKKITQMELYKNIDGINSFGTINNILNGNTCNLVNLKKIMEYIVNKEEK